MKRMLEIEMCVKCPFNDYFLLTNSCYCLRIDGHSWMGRKVPMEIINEAEIPSWCPLPKAEEKNEAK